MNSKTDVKFWSELSFGSKEWISRSEEEEMGAMDGIYVYLIKEKIRFIWGFKWNKATWKWNKERITDRGDWIGNCPIFEFWKKIDNGYFLLVTWYYCVPFIDSIKSMGAMSMKRHILF